MDQFSLDGFRFNEVTSMIYNNSAAGEDELKILC